MKKKLTALVLSLVLAAMPATPVMNVHTDCISSDNNQGGSSEEYLE